MICYLDKRFCSQKCANKECSRNFNDEVMEGARAWWGDDSEPPIAFGDMRTDDCGFFAGKLKMINWKVHKIKPVECIYTPREQYRGRKLLPGHKELTGRRIELVALWLMDDDDPYPGEWALASPDSYRVFGRAWIASGDVIPIRKFLFSVARHARLEHTRSRVLV